MNLAADFERAWCEEPHDITCFQTASSYVAQIDIAADMVLIHGVQGPRWGSTKRTFEEEITAWQERGYTVGMMTNASYGRHLKMSEVTESGEKRSYVQTMADGTEIHLANQPNWPPYGVPTQPFIDSVRKVVTTAAEHDVHTVVIEEPEFWARAGWSEAFKQEWQRFYGEPWIAPNSSVEAQYKASKLKYELFSRLLTQAFAPLQSFAKKAGRKTARIVASHSLLNYTHWRIVSPQSRILEIPDLAGVIAQVWSSTARTPNLYQGKARGRTLEVAYLEYGQMIGLFGSAPVKIWLLADPVDDVPGRSWDTYRSDYEATLIASLLHPECYRYEVVPWPVRVFASAHLAAPWAEHSDESPIPPSYSTELLTVFNALADMDQEEVRFDTGTRGIGVVVSDSMMFQRGEPDCSDLAMGSFYGVALPLVKWGVPLGIAHLENAKEPGYLNRYELLVLTYEHQKPLKPEYHEMLNQWVRNGGCLLYIGDGTDPYHDVPEWWNNYGNNERKAYEDLFERLGVTSQASIRPEHIGQGYVRVVHESPATYQLSADGAQRVRDLVTEMLEAKGKRLSVQNYQCIRRGPYLVASVFDESMSDEPLRLEGTFVDLLDVGLPVLRGRVVRPGEWALLYDLDWARANGSSLGVAAAATRVRNEQAEEDRLTFEARGPVGTTATICIIAPDKPQKVSAEPDVPFRNTWDPDFGIARLSFPNSARDVEFTIEVRTQAP
jgi:hypothetical protein